MEGRKVDTMGPSGLVIGIDTGQHTGWAWGHGAILQMCGLWNMNQTKPIHIPWAEPAGTAIIEVPEYRQENSRAKIDDLLILAARAGRVQEWALSYGFQTRLVKPSEWKGSIEKTMHNNRVKKRLTPPERAIVDRALDGIPKGLHNNVWDGIGLFLYQVGRDANRGIL